MMRPHRRSSCSATRGDDGHMGGGWTHGFDTVSMKAIRWRAARISRAWTRSIIMNIIIIAIVILRNAIFVRLWNGKAAATTTRCGRMIMVITT